jgi:GcrA cell cycle regulator
MEQTVHIRNPWSDAEDARLRELVAENLSYAAISALMGRNRNACIGRAHRIGLQVKGTRPITVKKVRQDVAKAIVKLFPATQAPLRLKPPAQKAPAPAPAQDNKPVPLYAQPEASTTAFGKPRTLVDLQPHHCRWPVSGERADTLFCCADREVMTRPYCAEHHLVAWRPPADKRDLSRLAKVYR